jgi:hypothetical protein
VSFQGRPLLTSAKVAGGMLATVGIPVITTSGWASQMPWAARSSPRRRCAWSHPPGTSVCWPMTPQQRSLRKAMPHGRRVRIAGLLPARCRSRPAGAARSWSTSTGAWRSTQRVKVIWRALHLLPAGHPAGAGCLCDSRRAAHRHQRALVRAEDHQRRAGALLGRYAPEARRVSTLLRNTLDLRRARLIGAVRSSLDKGGVEC